jgi:hypothetical protein
MRSLIFAGALIAVAGASAVAQGPVATEGRRAPGAEMLLARTGELGLTDAQVTRLAGIARRSAARRATMRASRDSIRARFTPGTRPDSALRRQVMERVRADMERARDQERTDRRDAIAVLTADQQARAWEFVSNRGGRGGMRPGGMRPGGQRRPGPGMRGDGGMRGGPGMQGGDGPRRQMRQPGEPGQRRRPIE